MIINVSQEIESVCPEFVGACVEAQVVNTPYCEELWQEIKALGERFRNELTTDSLFKLFRPNRNTAFHPQGAYLTLSKESRLKVYAFLS